MNSRKLFQPLIHPFQGGDSVVKRLEQTNLAASKLVHDLFHHLQLRLFLLAKHAGPVQKENLEALNRGLSLATQRANRFLDFTSDRSGKLESLDLAAFRSERGLDPHYLFYCYTCGPGEGGEIDGGGLRSPYSWTIWRPRSWPALPPGLSSIRIKLRFLFRWAVHRLHLFAGSGCGVLLVYERGELVHYSGFTPGYWRFPFVVGEDFQIGDTWTRPADRGKGFALFAVRAIVRTLARPGRRLWYVVGATNASSIRVAEKAKFTLAGEGTWVKPWKLKLIGFYVIRRNRSA